MQQMQECRPCNSRASIKHYCNLCCVIDHISFCCNAESITCIKWACVCSFSGSYSANLWRGWVRGLRAHAHPSVQFSKVRQRQGIGGHVFFLLFPVVRPVVFILFRLAQCHCCTLRTQTCFWPFPTSVQYLFIDLWSISFMPFILEVFFFYSWSWISEQFFLQVFPPLIKIKWV